MSDTDRVFQQPEIIERDKDTTTVRIAIRLRRCSNCDHPMLDRGSGSYARQRVHWVWDIPEIDWEYGEIRYFGKYFDGKLLCQQCAADNRVTFKCAICQIERGITELHGTHYDEPECKHCYTTMTAKVWDEWHEEQDARNRYNYD